MDQFFIRVDSQQSFTALAEKEKGFSAFSTEITEELPANLLVGIIGNRLVPLRVVKGTEVEKYGELIMSIEVQ